MTVEYPDFLDHLEREGAALRAAVLAAGPDADVPTCAGWTVDRLVGHLARVYDWTLAALRTDPADPPPGRTPRPDLGSLDWWDASFAKLLDRLRELDPAAPAWTINQDHDARFWARRQAHETAIHRLDAELAAGPAADLAFDPLFAADGIDEFVRTMVLGARRPYDGERTGTVLVHAADAGRAWLVTITPGEPFTTTEQPGLAADASIVGTADAVYRSLWGRPSHAVVAGDRALLDLLAGP